VIDAGDYDVWKMHYGEHAGSGAGTSAAVPEPTSLLLVLSAVFLLKLGRLSFACRGAGE
jgi:hypothetical protein